MDGLINDLRVTLIQADLFWEDIEANFVLFDKEMAGLENQTDLIVLPEMFATGFSLNAENLAQQMDGPIVKWMLAHSRELCADIVGSVIIHENGAYYNRLIWARPSGKIHLYDKKNLFRYDKEHKVYTPGSKKIVVELNGWKIRPFVCYDLRFPVWTRNNNNEYDLCVYVANWPTKRSFHWQALLAARAIENQAYVVGVNRVGTDGNGREYRGDSTVYDPRGGTLYTKRGAADTSTIVLSYRELVDYRSEFPAWMDADHGEIET